MQKLMDEVFKSGNTPNWFGYYNYLTVMGSRAYGTEVETSDYDFVGFLIPPISVVFPHTKGSVAGFGKNIQNFEQIQLQHLQTSDFGVVDITFYNIVKYFQLLMGGNPNLIDSIFTKDTSIKFIDNVGSLVKENRHLFLSQKCFHTFRGMLFSHLSRIKSGHVKEGRKVDGAEFDWKDGYHCVRMCEELDEILFEGDLTLGRNRDILMMVRNGETSKEDVVAYCERFLSDIEYTMSNDKESIKVPYSPDEVKIKKLLIDCFDLAYGENWKQNIGYNRYES